MILQVESSGGELIVNTRRVKTASVMMSLSLMLVILAGCGSQTATKNSSANANANIKTGVKPVADSEVAIIEMENPAYGRMVIELYPNIAPKMVERFKQLIKEGFYNGTTFHRIDPELGIIQGGDPFSKGNDPDKEGTGDSKYANVPGEFSDVPFDRGIVGAARKGAGPSMTDEQARDTNNCQFYITLKRIPAFDGNYVVFGRVIEGMNNADIIAGAPVDPPTPRRPEASHPSDKIVIKSITLQSHK
jgi:cyclophilin family peptidyl-prolyl cis-trans isomerase